MNSFCNLYLIIHCRLAVWTCLDCFPSAFNAPLRRLRWIFRSDDLREPEPEPEPTEAAEKRGTANLGCLIQRAKPVFER